MCNLPSQSPLRICSFHAIDCNSLRRDAAAGLVAQLQAARRGARSAEEAAAASQRELSAAQQQMQQQQGSLAQADSQVDNFRKEASHQAAQAPPPPGVRTAGASDRHIPVGSLKVWASGQ